MVLHPNGTRVHPIYSADEAVALTSGTRKACAQQTLTERPVRQAGSGTRAAGHRSGRGGHGSESR